MRVRNIAGRSGAAGKIDFVELSRGARRSGVNLNFTIGDVKTQMRSASESDAWWSAMIGGPMQENHVH